MSLNTPYGRVMLRLKEELIHETIVLNEDTKFMQNEELKRELINMTYAEIVEVAKGLMSLNQTRMINRELNKMKLKDHRKKPHSKDN